MQSLSSLLLLVSPAAADRWDLLRAGAEAWHALQFDANFSINVGDETGTLFRWESPGFSSSSSYLAGASLSKWPAAIMISGLVNDGLLSYDDLASKHLPWWTTEPADPRSRVKLWHLLSFTSGFYGDGRAALGCAHGVPARHQFMACAESLYNRSSSWGYEPSTHWAYLTCHLQFAGAMAVAASGMEIDHLFQKYLYRPFNMTSTVWYPIKNPTMAAGIVTTANDFEQLLQRLLTYEVLPRALLDRMEIDYSQPPCNPSGDGWFGHYGMGHWWECIGYGTPSRPYERERLPRSCLATAIQAGPGLYGYYPLLDRSGGGGDAGPTRPQYYFQVALQEPNALSGIPEYLRMIAKPVVDVILSGEDPYKYDREAMLSLDGGLLMRDLNDIQSALGKCHCAKHPLQPSQPYAALAGSLSADQPNITRRQITSSRHEGLLLRDLVAIQKGLGPCKCEGREAAKRAAAVPAAVVAAAVHEQGASEEAQ